MSVDKNLLKRLRILYVEDDDIIRTELSELLSKFFGKVYVSKDGKEALETYLHNQDDIHVILTDINMPKLSGIEVVKTIREINSKIPVIFATAHSDNEFLEEAIKLRVYEYIVKPIDIRYLLTTMNELANVLYQESMIDQQTKELESYKNIINSNNIVLKTDVHMNITYVNDLFCQITGFSEDELVGREFKSLRHPDSSNDLYTNMYAKVLNNKPWHGKLKNLTKDHGTFITDAYMMASLNDSGEIIGAICIQKDITEEQNKRRDIQLALMKDKSDIFIRSKEGSAEQSLIINDLKLRLENTQKELIKVQHNVDRYIYTAEKYTVENRNLKTELASYKKSADQHGTAMKVSKENSDLRLEIKRLNSIIEEINIRQEKEVLQLKVNYQVEIDELEENLKILQDKYESVESDEILSQKLEYWKEKAKNESRRIESLEKQIIAHGDQSFMNKIFG